MAMTQQQLWRGQRTASPHTAQLVTSPLHAVASHSRGAASRSLSACVQRACWAAAADCGSLLSVVLLSVHSVRPECGEAGRLVVRRQLLPLLALPHDRLPVPGPQRQEDRAASSLRAAGGLLQRLLRHLVLPVLRAGAGGKGDERQRTAARHESDSSRHSSSAVQPLPPATDADRCADCVRPTAAAMGSPVVIQQQVPAASASGVRAAADSSRTQRSSRTRPSLSSSTHSSNPNTSRDTRRSPTEHSNNERE